MVSMLLGDTVCLACVAMGSISIAIRLSKAVCDLLMNILAALFLFH